MGEGRLGGRVKGRGVKGGKGCEGEVNKRENVSRDDSIRVQREVQETKGGVSNVKWVHKL
jgi:hypothetical protein